MELYKLPLHFMLLGLPAHLYAPSMSPYFMFKHMRLITNIHDNFAVATQKNSNVIGHTLLSPLKFSVKMQVNWKAQLTPL